MNYTTLRRIQACDPCEDGWEALLAHLGKTKADDEPLSLREILDSNGLEDAIWCLCAIDACPEIRLFVVRCVREVQHLLTDPRSLEALDIAELFAVGEATEEELRTARKAAETVAWNAWDADAVWKAAWDAAWAAVAATAASVGEAAWDAAWDAVAATAASAGKAAWAAAGQAAYGVREEEENGRKRMESIQRRDFIDIFCQE